MKKLIFIDACMRTGSRTKRIARPIIAELRKVKITKAIEEGLEICKTF